MKFLNLLKHADENALEPREEGPVNRAEIIARRIVAMVLEFPREARGGRRLRTFFSQLAALAQLEKEGAQPAEEARIENWRHRSFAVLFQRAQRDQPRRGTVT